MRIGALDVSKKDLELKHWRPLTIESIKGKDALKTMEKGSEIIAKTGINWWISSGNLLGLYRDNKLIEHDTDIDVNVSLKWDSLESNILSKQVLVGLTSHGFEVIRTIVYKNHFMQLATIDVETDVIFDICFFYTGIIKNRAVHLCMEGYYEKPLKFINNPIRRIYNGLEYSTPNHTEEFLTWKYGEWKNPANIKVPWHNEAPSLKRWT